MSAALLSLTEIISAASVCRVTGAPARPGLERAADGIERRSSATTSLQRRWPACDLPAELGEDEQFERRADRQRPVGLERCRAAGAPSPSRATATMAWPGSARSSASTAARLSPRMSAPVSSRPPIRCGGCGSIAICMCTIARSKRDVDHPGLRRQRRRAARARAPRHIGRSSCWATARTCASRDLGEEGRR